LLPTTLVSLSITALIAEVAAFVRANRAQADGRGFGGARPADGLVDLVNLADVESLPCLVRPDVRRFVTLTGEESPRSPHQPINRPLLGKIALVSVFVGKDGSSWLDEEIAKGHEAVERAAVWVEREAIRLGARVNLSLADVYFQVEDVDDDPVEVSFSSEGDDVGPMEANATTKAVVMASRAASRLGFVDVADWMRRINNRLEVDATAWLFHIRRAGRSMAISTDLSDIPGVGFAVCYAREASFPEPLSGRGRVDSTTIAHELLHLFGASDKYGIALSSYPKGWVSSREIMRLNHDSLSRMTVDPLTAIEIGWSSRAADLTIRTKKSRRRPR
jgi:hypothetical protein